MSSEEESAAPTIFTEPVERIQCGQCGHIVDMRGSPPFSERFCPSCGAKKKVPARLGTYLLLECIGNGGMGAVFRGLDPSLDRMVAVKVMNRALGQDPAALAAFRKEARAAARFNHPHAAQIFTFGESNGQPYLVMEFVQGRPLSDLVQDSGALEQALVVGVGLQTAEALAVAADADLLHGDVKPENIIVDENGQSKLIDFGLAAFVDQQSQGQIWGSPYYMAPERILRQKTDFRADIYSLGATMYEALTGRPPFAGEDVRQVLNAHVAGNPTPATLFRRDLDPEIEKIVMRMIRRQPAERYPNYDSLTGDLTRSYGRIGAHHARGRRVVTHAAHAAHPTPRPRPETPAAWPALRAIREEPIPTPALRPIPEAAGLRARPPEPAPQRVRLAPEPGQTMMLSLPEAGLPAPNPQREFVPTSQPFSAPPGEKPRQEPAAPTPDYQPRLIQPTNPMAPTRADLHAVIAREKAQRQTPPPPPTRSDLRSVASRPAEPQAPQRQQPRREPRRMIVRQDAASSETTTSATQQIRHKQEPNVTPFLAMLGVIAVIVLIIIGLFLASQQGGNRPSQQTGTVSQGSGQTRAQTPTPQRQGQTRTGAEEAADDRTSTRKGRSVTVQVLDNDGTGADGKPPAIVSISNPKNGFAAVQRSTIGYRPQPGFTGTDEFQYTVKYPSGRTSTATVTIEVTAE